MSLSTEHMVIFKYTRHIFNQELPCFSCHMLHTHPLIHTKNKFSLVTLPQLNTNLEEEGLVCSIWLVSRTPHSSIFHLTDHCHTTFKQFLEVYGGAWSQLFP